MIVNIDRVVVVTGVSLGIGHGIAKTLIAHQCHVFGRSAYSSPPFGVIRMQLPCMLDAV